MLARIAADAGVAPAPVLAGDALQHLLRYAFPGNVRELENLLHRALALAAGHEIGRGDLGLPEELLQDAALADPEPAAAATVGRQTPKAAAPPAPTALPADLAVYLDEVEREILERALERHRYNRTAAGASLGLSLRQMRYRMARLGVGSADGPGERGEPS